MLSFIIMGCASISESGDIYNQQSDGKNLYDITTSEFLKHINEAHFCRDAKIIAKEPISRDDKEPITHDIMVISEKWTAGQGGVIMEHIVTRAADPSGKTVIGIGELDNNNCKPK